MDREDRVLPRNTRTNASSMRDVYDIVPRSRTRLRAFLLKMFHVDLNERMGLDGFDHGKNRSDFAEAPSFRPVNFPVVILFEEERRMRSTVEQQK